MSKLLVLKREVENDLDEIAAYLYSGREEVRELMEKEASLKKIPFEDAVRHRLMAERIESVR